jgi:tryptophan halogenase|tara:strand:+ start:4370 stop:5854 length:1485 start_codon:yes stop_codon:yes gene_type:complete
MNITIVGGGTAGWLAALMISKIQKDMHTVTIIDSSAIGIIGAGEASTGYLRGIINNEIWDFGCNEFDFFKECKATPKLGILHKDWKSIGHEYLAPADATVDDPAFGCNTLLSNYIANEVPMHNSSVGGRLVSNKLTPFYTDNNQLVSIGRHSYNFDARLAAKYLEKICGTGVTKIDAKVNDIILNNFGQVEKLVLDNNQTVLTDFVIDASGFSKLFSNKLNVKWQDYPELTLNAALPFLMPEDKNTDFVATSWAQKHGWMFKIPKLDITGCGYAYDDRFITPDQAQEEIEIVLGHKIEPIKNIKYNPGRLETVWNSNVLSIGLSASFLEPLEATSIHATIVQLNKFIFTHLKETVDRTINKSSVKKYNTYMSQLFDDYKTFILVHYTTSRTDTEFWRNANLLAKNYDPVKEILNISKDRLLNQSDLTPYYGYVQAELYNYILCGLGHYTKETAVLESNLLSRNKDAIREEARITKFLSQHNWLSNKEILDYIRR